MSFRVHDREATVRGLMIVKRAGALRGVRLGKRLVFCLSTIHIPSTWMVERQNAKLCS